MTLGRFGPGPLPAAGMGFRSQNSGDRSQKKGKDNVATAASWDQDLSTDICPLTPDPHAPEAVR